jgi:hypothetical protein
MLATTRYREGTPMNLALNFSREESLIGDFFRASAGEWRSERRYYTLTNDTAKEVVSDISIVYLAADAPELVTLADLHRLDGRVAICCGAIVTWESQESGRHRPSEGRTIFGASGNILYRDRGFATTDPVTAIYRFNGPQTLSLRTEYAGSAFEEEIKLIGTKYRTRQTIVSRMGEELLIGQYLEKRLEK